MRRFHLTTLITILLLFAACGGPNLETRTFELKYLDHGEAEALVEPYIFHEDARLGGSGHLLTVREAPDNLEQIAQVLERYDRQKPGVRLYFQIIRANGSESSDPEIAEVESSLRRLFRFTGYELVAEALVAGVEGSQAQQVVAASLGPRRSTFEISANILQVRATGDSGTVRVFINFMIDGDGILRTGVNLRTGQTAVLGNVQQDPGSDTIILTVRPEFVAQ